MDVNEELDSVYELSDEQVTSFHEAGWVRLPGLLSPDTARDVYERIAGFSTVAPTESEKWMTEDAYKKVLQMHDGMAWQDDFFRGLAVSRRVAGAALRLLRTDEATFFLDMSFIKPGEKASQTPFHQDYPHWPFDRRGQITIWVALTDISEEMGPLQFLRGSHLEGPLGRYSRQAGDDVRLDYPDLEKRCPAEAGTALQAGDATVHWELTVHGTSDNQTDRERAAYTARYMLPGTRYTGSPHRHFDQFDMEPNDRFGDVNVFPQVSLG